MQMYGKYLVFLFTSLAISIGLQILLPFPYGLITALAIFILFPVMLRRRLMKGGMFGTGGIDQVKLTKTCTVCGKKCNDRQCKRCGSNQFRMG